MRVGIGIVVLSVLLSACTPSPAAPAPVRSRPTVVSAAAMGAAVRQEPTPPLPPEASATPTDTTAPESQAATAQGAGSGATSAALPAFSHVFIIVMENKESSSVFGSDQAPYQTQLAKQYAYAANYFGITHPSLPNYLSLIGGGTFGVASDCTECRIKGESLVNQLEKAGRSWKAYMESMPSPCYKGPDTDLYAQRHNPFIYFDGVRNQPELCNKIVSFDQFKADLRADSLPEFAWISPNLCNDTHDCPVKTGDDWLSRWIPQILDSSAWKDNGVLFLTYDEGKTTGGCCQYADGGRVGTIVVSPLARNGFVSNVAYDHYSLLRTIEEAWGLPLLDRAGSVATKPMTDFFAQP